MTVLHKRIVLFIYGRGDGGEPCAQDRADERRWNAG